VGRTIPASFVSLPGRVAHASGRGGISSARRGPQPRVFPRGGCTIVRGRSTTSRCAANAGICRTTSSQPPVSGRIAYIPIVVRRFDIAGSLVKHGVWMTVVNTVTGATTPKARAPLPAGFYPDPYMTMSVFDSLNRVVIFPVISGACGHIEKLLVYLCL
jgi:hypothetical protein